jgi:lipopolysaccharide biosynthesis glycosyltransferase
MSFKVFIVLDAELAWRLAREGAIFIFDDYNWGVEPVESMHHPRRGIDAFLALHEGQYERLSKPSDYQVVLQKTSEMRIGFLIKEQEQNGSSIDDAFGYSINIAITIDQAYAPAAAVAMRTVVDHTPGRITFYIAGIDLLTPIRDKLRASLPDRANVTVNFVDLPSTGLASTSGITWAKMDMIGSLPVERVLYLDADVLVRADLAKLWQTDLSGKSIATAQDIGFPLGHGERVGTKYFNAGVILMDLAKIRARLPELISMAERARSSRFKDQDALNKHFRDDWLELDLVWNAQGLGTYAEQWSAERSALNLDAMRSKPLIVHFTGPVHPTLASVINPYVQPVNAKPWGYVGAPGQPFAAEWWAALERTAWSGWRETEEFKTSCLYARGKAEQEGITAFHKAVDETLAA